MKRRFAVVLTALLLFAPSRLIAKGPTTKIVIEGADLQKPIEITDPKILAKFHVWTRLGQQGLIIDWSEGPVSEPPRTLPRYKVSFYAGNPPDDRMVYVVFYTVSPTSAKGCVYLPGKSDEWYRLNTRSIWRGDEAEGKWFPAWSAWERVARPLIEKAALTD